MGNANSLFGGRFIDTLSGRSRMSRALYGLTLFDCLTGADAAVIRAHRHPMLDSIRRVRSLLEPEPEYSMGLVGASPSKRYSGQNRLEEDAAPLFDETVEEIKRVRRLLSNLESLRLQPVDADESNESKTLLHRYWRALCPTRPPPAFSKKSAEKGIDLTKDPGAWPYIGFQSSNPSRDFRQSGHLGLHLLTNAVEAFPGRAREMLEESHAEGLYYPFSSVGLNVLSWVRELLDKGELTVFFDLNEADGISTLGVILFYVWLEFHRFWRVSRPVDLMQFGKVRDRFRGQLEPLLERITNFNGKVSHPIGVNTGADLISELSAWIEGSRSSFLNLSVV